MTRNQKVLEDFVAYCKANPEQRFWQALRNWSGAKFIWFDDKSSSFEVVEAIRNRGLKDTFNWEGKDQ